MAKGASGQRYALRYRRMSFDDSDEQLRRQVVDVDAICELHDYVTKPEWLFSDADESGNEDTRFRQGKGERPALRALDEELHALTRIGHSVVVVAWVPNRLFRDAGHKEHYFRRWARAGDVLVHTKQGVWNPNDARDRFVSTVVAGADQYYSDDVREKVMRAQEERRRKGLPATGWPGFGHRRACGCDRSGRCGKPEHDQWVAEPDEARLVQDAARRIVSGTGISRIAEEFAAADVPTRLGGKWTITSLRRVLISPRLIGVLVHNGVELGKTDAIEPLLDEATYRRMVDRITARRNGPRRGKQLLTGILVCGVCGGTLNSNMKRKTGKETYRVYGCRADGQCNIKGEAVEEIVVEKMFQRLSDKRFSAALARTDEESAQIADQLREQNEELESLKAHAARLPVDVYVAKFDAINVRVQELNRLLARSGPIDLAASWIGQAPRLRRAWDSMAIDEQRALILSVVGPVRVLPAAKRGRYATPEEIRARLVPLAGTS